MRQIKNLNFETQNLLNRIHKLSKKHDARQRAKCIILSFKGFSISQLVLIFDVHLNTIYNWFNGWEEVGLLSLYNSKGQGRKPKISIDDEEFINQLITQNPKRVKKVASAFESQKGIKISERTIKRFLKKNSI